MSTQPIISAALDMATVADTRWLITELRADGHSIEQTSEIAAEHLADMVALYGPAERERRYAEETRAIEASLIRQDRFYRQAAWIEATS
jgi:hypothetical protein